jgi:hypothetical protein
LPDGVHQRLENGGILKHGGRDIMREETMIHVEKSPMKTEEIREVWAERLLKYKMDIQSGKPTDEFAIIEGFLSVEVGGGWINPNDNK